MSKGEKKEGGQAINIEEKDFKNLTDGEKEFIRESQEIIEKIDGIDEQDLRSFQYERAEEIRDEWGNGIYYRVYEGEEAPIKLPGVAERRGMGVSVKKALNICGAEIGQALKDKSQILIDLKQYRDRGTYVTREFSESELRELKIEDKADRLLGYKKKIEINKEITEEDRRELMTEINSLREEIRAARRALVEEFAKREKEASQREREETKKKLENLREEIKNLTEEKGEEKEES